ncbi:MAG: hypothetical protein FJY67_04645 [Calditrichaeota bacterium]|nr:hypothetical protein [Calditrichota bacterium]
MPLSNLTRLRALAAALVMSLTSVIAPVHGADVIGRYGGDFMGGAGARRLALGGAGAALGGDLWSLFWNPSGLAEVQRTEAALMHSERFTGVVDYDVLGFAVPRPDATVEALGALRLGVNGIPFTRLERPNDPLTGGNRVEIDRVVSDGEYAFYVARAGRSVADLPLAGRLDYRWGLAPKLLFKHIGNYRAYGLGLDLGVGKSFVGTVPVEAGIGVRDLLGSILAWEQTGRKEVIPSTLRAGIAARLDLPPLEAVLTPLADVVYRFDLAGGSDAASLHYGAEYLVRDIVALRVGSDDGRLTLGGGLALSAVAIDYGFIGHDDLGDSHRISLTARWGR